MNRLGKQIVLFLIPLTVVWLGLEWFYRTTPNNYTYKAERVSELYTDTEVLILGSSHAFFGLNPTYFSRSAYNLSNISQSFYFDELLLKKHIDSMPRLKAVVLPVGYFSLSQKDDGLEDRWRKYFYDQQMELEVPTVSATDPKRYSLALSRRFDRSVQLVRTYFEAGTLISCFPSGYGMQDSTDIVADKQSISKIIARKHEDGSLDFKSNTNRLQRMISLCGKRNVLFVPVIMPVHPDYYKALRADKWAKIKASLKTLEQYNVNTHFLDLSRDPGLRTDDLRDADHLTNQGAAKYSRLISSYLNDLLNDQD